MMTLEQINFLKNNFDTYRVVDICKLLNLPKYVIQHQRKKLGLSKLNSVNESFFSELNLTSCYVAGNIAADGCVSTRNRLCFHISEEDQNYLNELRSILNFNGAITRISRPFYNLKIKSRKPKMLTSVSMQITSQKIVNDLLINFNIGPRKSSSLQPPSDKLTEEQRLAYIKGYIDGDGWICLIGGRLILGIVGTQLVLEWIKKEFSKIVDIQSFPQQRKESPNCYVLTITGKRASNILKTLLFLKTPKLDRKWKKVEEFFGFEKILV